MANTTKVMDSIKNFLEKMKANDASIPEELAEDACAMVEEVKDALCESEDADPEVEKNVEDEEPKEEEIEKKVEDAMVKVLRKYGLVKDGAMEALDELEEKLGEETTDVDGEESVTVDPEQMNDSARRELLKQVKPIIAGVKDSVQRKALSDAFAKSIGFGMTQTADYAKILESTKKSAQDAAVKHNDHSDVDFGMEIARKYNPHYMKEDN